MSEKNDLTTVRQKLEPESRVKIGTRDKEYEMSVERIYGEDQDLPIQESAFDHFLDREFMGTHSFELQVSSDEGSVDYDVFMSPEECYLRVQKGPNTQPSWKEINYRDIEVL